MYIIINKGLRMSPGKIGAQCAHAACMVIENISKATPETLKIYREWSGGSYTKIVLQADETTMLNLIREYSDKKALLWCEYVRDEGRTEIENGSLTAIAFTPMKIVPVEIKRLRLL